MRPPAHLLDPWPGDSTRAVSPRDGSTDHLFAEFTERARGELRWLAETVEQIGQAEDEEVFDQLYRRGHVLSGFASIMALPKAGHLLAILDFVLDHARALHSFERHSMDYLVKLLGDATQVVLDGYRLRGESDLDIADQVEECARYLQEPLQRSLAPAEPEPPMDLDGGAEPGLGSPPIVGGGAAEPSAALADVGEGPEWLDIPADKVGLLSDFYEECQENLTLIGQGLIALEETDRPAAAVNELFRAVHTVKGGARMLGIRKMEALTHRMESLLDQVRQGSRPVDVVLIDVLLDGCKYLERLLGEVASRGPMRTEIRGPLQAMAALDLGLAPADAIAPGMSQPAAQAGTAAPALPVAQPGPASEPAKSGAARTDSIRIATQKLDDVLNTASEIFVTRIRLQSDMQAIRSAIKQLDQMLQRTAQPDPRALDERLAEAGRHLLQQLKASARRDGEIPLGQLDSMVHRSHEELLAGLQEHLSTSPETTFQLLSIEEVRSRLQENVDNLEQLTGRLQSGAMGFRMVPIRQLFDRFPTQVREIARQLGKRVKLSVGGGDTELDKVLIDQLADPLLHILRNALDHGIEPEDQRARSGKSEVGHIGLAASYQGSHVMVEVTDDGRGIEVDKVRDTAIARGLVEPERAAALDRSEILEFIFEPGFSTVSAVSELSGRGVGMDVVRSAISHIQGSVAIDSQPGRGTTFRIKLPLTLAIIGILMVEEGPHQFALPILNVDELLHVSKDEIRQLSGNAFYNHRGKTLPVTTLSNVLGFPPSGFPDERVGLVILAEAEKRVGVLVDAVLGRQEVLIKNLGSLVRKVPFVMGCTISSDSRLVLILSAWEIVHRRTGRPHLGLDRGLGGRFAARQAHPVLVVEDSALQRRRLSAALRQAGYPADTAENGFAALKQVRERRYAAFCVDIVMPLMDGLEFVDRLRQMPEHRQSPVVVVTGRDVATERTRAAGYGVQDYFIKPVEAEHLIQALDRRCLGKPAASAVRAADPAAV